MASCQDWAALAEESLDAIVLRRRDSGENDRRLTVLTRERGKIDVTARGSRKVGSRLSGASEPLAASRLSIAFGPRYAIVTQAQPITSFPKLRSTYERLSSALALAELYSAVLPYEQEDQESYDLLLLSLRAIECHAKPLVAHVWCQLKLMATAGFLPDFDPSSHPPVNLVISPSLGQVIASDMQPRPADAIPATRETLIGLSKSVALESPPLNLKEEQRCLRVLYSVWRQIADCPLPANEALLAELRLDV